MYFPTGNLQGTEKYLTQKYIQDGHIEPYFGLCRKRELVDNEFGSWQRLAAFGGWQSIKSNTLPPHSRHSDVCLLLLLLRLGLRLRLRSLPQSHSYRNRIQIHKCRLSMQLVLPTSADVKCEKLLLLLLLLIIR